MSTLVSRPTSWFRDELYAASRAVSGAFERMTAHRQEKANAFVRTYLARLSDSELANLKSLPSRRPAKRNCLTTSNIGCGPVNRAAFQPFQRRGGRRRSTNVDQPATR